MEKVTYILEGKEISHDFEWAMFTDKSNGKIVFHDESITGLSSYLDS
ncbi:hypothetical protein [Flavobacterium chilense]|nr:hypothetical protein [Flavobacterium chilense]